MYGNRLKTVGFLDIGNKPWGRCKDNLRDSLILGRAIRGLGMDVIYREGRCLGVHDRVSIIFWRRIV